MNLRSFGEHTDGLYSCKNNTFYQTHESINIYAYAKVYNLIKLLTAIFRQEPKFHNTANLTTTFKITYMHNYNSLFCFVICSLDLLLHYYVSSRLMVSCTLRIWLVMSLGKLVPRSRNPNIRGDASLFLFPNRSKPHPFTVLFYLSPFMTLTDMLSYCWGCSICLEGRYKVIIILIWLLNGYSSFFWAFISF